MKAKFGLLITSNQIEIALGGFDNLKTWPVWWAFVILPWPKVRRPKFWLRCQCMQLLNTVYSMLFSAAFTFLKWRCWFLLGFWRSFQGQEGDESIHVWCEWLIVNFLILLYSKGNNLLFQRANSLNTEGISSTQILSVGCAQVVNGKGRGFRGSFINCWLWDLDGAP